MAKSSASVSIRNKTSAPTAPRAKPANSGTRPTAPATDATKTDTAKADAPPASGTTLKGLVGRSGVVASRPPQGGVRTTKPAPVRPALPIQHWLIKSEPYKYAYRELITDGRTIWDGVRNFEARNSMRAMRVGDLALFYHSNEGKAVVGIARIVREAYPDPTAENDQEDWSAVDVEAVVSLNKPVSLDDIRDDPTLVDIALLRRSRLSVVPVSEAHFEHILRLGATKLRASSRLGAR